MRKGYRINLDKIEEGYLYSEYTCLAESRNGAKKELLKTFEGALKLSNDSVTYLTIPVVRYKEIDEVEFEGEIITKANLEIKLSQRKRIEMLDKFLTDESIKFMYIKKHGSYYRPNCCGYTDFITRAGIYDKKDAVGQAKSCDDLLLIPINIEEHNAIIKKEIEELKTRLLN